MAFNFSPKVVTDGLVLALDAANPKSYVSGSTVWRDLSNQNIVGTVVSGSFSPINQGAVVFNGSSSFCNITSSHSYLSSSALEVVFMINSTGSASTNKMVFGYRHNSGYSNPTIGSLFVNRESKIAASLITTTQVYRQVLDTSNVITSSIYHVVLNKDVEIGNMQLYVNGQLKNSNTFDSASYAQWNTTGSFIGSNALDLGRSSNTSDSQAWGSGSFFSGSIHIAKIYNRVLSSAEILQNYNATKTRFGL